jgi:hypothetical protein
MSFRNSRRKERRLLPGDVPGVYWSFATSIALFTLFFPCLGIGDGDVDGAPDCWSGLVPLPVALSPLTFAPLPAAFPDVVGVLVLPSVESVPVVVAGLPSSVTVNYKNFNDQTELKNAQLLLEV